MSTESWANAPTHNAIETVVKPPSAEKGMIQESESDKAKRLITSLAVDSHRKTQTATAEQKQNANSAETAFGVLGEAMSAEIFNSLDEINVADPTVDFTATDDEHRRFAPNEPRPRFRVVNGRAIPSYDVRAGGVSSEQPSAIKKGEYEIHTVHARLRTAEGTIQYCCILQDSDGNKGPHIIDEQTFVDSYILAQHSQIQSGLDKPATVNPRLVEQGVKAVLRPMTIAYAEHANTSDPNHVLEPAKGVDSTLLDSEAGDKLRPSRDQVKGLAVRMKTFVDADTARTGDSATIQKYIDAMEGGEDPSTEAILEIIKVAGRPKLQERLTDIDKDIAQIESALRAPTITPDREKELTADKDQLQKEKLLVKNILAGKKQGNTVFELLQDVQDGRGSADLAKLLGDKLENITDPAAFFELKADDLKDKNSLASIILKHFGESRGLTDEQMKEKVAWLSKFFKDHGSDIAMMGIFALFQMMTTMIGDAAKGAGTH
ncbi:hypothetical protein KBB12_00045 [Candidatus Woesebacteria bacterium]|nr:hypothetical protein [Candidatus Woesebacteria bacterium]